MEDPPNSVGPTRCSSVSRTELSRRENRHMMYEPRGNKRKRDEDGDSSDSSERSYSDSGDSEPEQITTSGTSQPRPSGSQPSESSWTSWPAWYTQPMVVYFRNPAPCDTEAIVQRRPPNVWLTYRSEKLKVLEAERRAGGGPRRTQAEYSTIIAKMWRAESAEAKQEFERRAYKDEEESAHRLEKESEMRRVATLGEKEQLKADRMRRGKRGRGTTTYRLYFPMLEAGKFFTPYSWAAQFMMKVRYGGEGPSPPLSLASTPTSSPPTTLENLPDVDTTSLLSSQNQTAPYALTNSFAASAPVPRDFAVPDAQTSLPSPAATFASPLNSPQTSEFDIFGYSSTAAPTARSQLEVIPEEPMEGVETNAYPTPPAECTAFPPSLLQDGSPDILGEGNTPFSRLGQFAHAPVTTHDDFSTPFDGFSNSFVGPDTSGNPAASCVSPKLAWDGSTNVSWPSGNLPGSVTPHDQTFKASPVNHSSSDIDPAVQSGPNSWDLDVTQLDALAPPSFIASEFDWSSITAVYPSNEDFASPSFATSIGSHRPLMSMSGLQNLSSASSELAAGGNPMDTLWKSLLLTSQQFDRELSQPLDYVGGYGSNGDLYPPPLQEYDPMAHVPHARVGFAPDLIPHGGQDNQEMRRNRLSHAVQPRLSGWNPVDIDSSFARSTATVANQFTNLQIRADSNQDTAYIPQYPPPPASLPNQTAIPLQMHVPIIPVTPVYGPLYSSYNDQHRRNAHLPSHSPVHALSSAPDSVSSIQHNAAYSQQSW